MKIVLHFNLMREPCRSVHWRNLPCDIVGYFSHVWLLPFHISLFPLIYKILSDLLICSRVSEFPHHNFSMVRKPTPITSITYIFHINLGLNHLSFCHTTQRYRETRITHCVLTYDTCLCLALSQPLQYRSST